MPVFCLCAMLKLAKTPLKKPRFSVFFLAFYIFYDFFPANIKRAKFAWNGGFWLNIMCTGSKTISSFFQ
jgi:hypothetical protein